MNPFSQHAARLLEQQTRRTFLGGGLAGLGGLWLAGQGASVSGSPAPPTPRDAARPLAPRPSPLLARAKRIIYLHLAGAPSQFELFDYKPELAKRSGELCPREFIDGQRFAFLRGAPELLGGQYAFKQTGESGRWISDRLPNFARVVDKVAFVRTMQTDQFNHAPGQLMVQTGNARLGYASLGSWITYGLGSVNENLPGYVVLLSGGKTPSAGKSAWGSGFLPSVYQGVQCRSAGEPVLFLDNPPGIDRRLRGRMVEAINAINRQTQQQTGDPETATRIAQYELAYRMQIEATDAMDLRAETADTHRAYGAEPGRESLANNCLLARRLVERGVRFVQLFDWGWDSHGANPNESLLGGFKKKCREVDQPVAALLTDLDDRGMLDDTLVVWGSEFGRTPMRENRGGRTMKNVGRDHHAKAFTIWMAGGGVKRGYSHGETDPFGFGPLTEPVTIRDFHATLLNLLGLDHERLSFPFQGLDQKLTGVQKPARLVSELFA